MGALISAGLLVWLSSALHGVLGSNVIALGCIAVGAFLFYLRARGVRMQASRQVPSWFTSIGGLGFFFFGIEMGVGWRTYSPTLLPHVVALTALGFAKPSLVVSAAVGFGLGRAVGMVLARRSTESANALTPGPAAEKVLALAITIALSSTYFWA